MGNFKGGDVDEAQDRILETGKSSEQTALRCAWSVVRFFWLFELFVAGSQIQGCSSFSVKTADALGDLVTMARIEKSIAAMRTKIHPL